MPFFAHLWIYKVKAYLLLNGRTLLQDGLNAKNHLGNLKKALMMAPALGLPDLTKTLELFVHERQHLALGVLAQRLGSWKWPVGYFSKQLDNVSKG